MRRGVRRRYKALKDSMVMASELPTKGSYLLGANKKAILFRMAF
jgi:hypothetical protein